MGELEEIQNRVEKILEEVVISEGRGFQLIETKIENVFRLFYVLEVAILMAKCKEKDKDWRHFNQALFRQKLESIATEKRSRGAFRYILNMVSVLRKEECAEHLKYVLATGRGGIKQPSRA